MTIEELIDVTFVELTPNMYKYMLLIMQISMEDDDQGKNKCQISNGDNEVE